MSFGKRPAQTGEFACCSKLRFDTIAMHIHCSDPFRSFTHMDDMTKPRLGMPESCLASRRSALAGSTGDGGQ